MPDDSATKLPKIPKIDEKQSLADADDPADAFARVKIEETPPTKPTKKGAKNKATPDRPREPIVVAAEDLIDEDAMTPLEAAEEIIGMMDNAFAIAVMFRGYDKILIQNADGTTESMLAKVTEKSAG